MPEVTPHSANTRCQKLEKGPQISFPSFTLPAENVDVLFTPTAFHDWLLRAYTNARKRIILAALYIGTGEAEEQIMQAMTNCCRSHETANENLTVDILFDSARGTRLESSGKSSLSMVENLLKLKSGVVDIRLGLFHSPLLSGFLYHLLPPRINEVLGVFHTKVFLADDSVVLTGANLSESYLTDRQDRYIVIRDAPLLCDALQRLVRFLQSFSYFAQLTPSPPTRSVCIGFNPQDSIDESFDVADARKTVMVEPSPLSQYKPSLSIPGFSRRQFYPLLDGSVITLSLAEGVPSPIESPYAFSAALGSGLLKYLKHYEGRECLEALPSSPFSRNATKNLATVHMAIQAGFAIPSIQQEEDLLRIILGHSISNAGFLSSLRTRLHRLRRRQRDLRAYSRQSDLAGPFHKPLGHIILASGYLNMTDELLTHLISPDPDANGEDYGAICLSDEGDDDEESGDEGGDVERPQQMSQHLQTRIGSDDSSLTTRAATTTSLSSSSCSVANGKTAGGNEKGEMQRSLEVFMAAPEANSFHESKGPSKYIPMAYSYVGATQLLRLRDCWGMKPRGWLGVLRDLILWPIQKILLLIKIKHEPLIFPELKQESISNTKGPQFWEFNRPNWTFHSKGVWLYPPPARRTAVMNPDCDSTTVDAKPIGTVIGSSNFGLRSRVRDLDVSFLICSENDTLRRKFESEVTLMRTHSTPADVSTLVSRCPSWLRMLLRCCSTLKTLL